MPVLYNRLVGLRPVLEYVKNIPEGAGKDALIHPDMPKNRRKRQADPRTPDEMAFP